MTNGSLSWVGILALAIYGICFIACWMSNFAEIKKIVRPKGKLDSFDAFPEPMATEETLIVFDTLEMLSGSFDGFDGGFDIDF